MDTKVVEVGVEAVQIRKLYGPLVACDVVVRLDIEKGEWVVERERHLTGDGLKRDWEEVARFDCQESLAFPSEGS